MPTSPQLEAFHIGLICALPIAAAAAREMLDEIFDFRKFQDPTDLNVYTLGRIGYHYVVIACLPAGQYGTTLASTVAASMARTFSQSLRIGLIVGTGGGVPSAAHDIRLGDVVIGYPNGTCGGMVQYDIGNVGIAGEFIPTGSLQRPPPVLLAAVHKMRSAALIGQSLYPDYLYNAIRRTAGSRRNFERPDAQQDRLFKPMHDHPAAASNCDGCLAEWEEKRHERVVTYPQLHYGIIASGNFVIRHGGTREQLRLHTGALCFEMEAAGLMSDFPCIVIRGICDYADSHKNKQWQGYAALAAASCAKELLEYVPDVSHQKTVADTLMIDRRYDLRSVKYQFERGGSPNVDHEPEDDNKSSVAGDQTDIESTFSIESTSSWQSSQSEIMPTAISELSRLLLKDDQLKDLFLTAISKVGPERFRRNFSRMLKRYGLGLNREASDEIQREAAHFVRLTARRVATEIQINLMESNPELFIKKKPEGARLELARVNEWVESYAGGRTDLNAENDGSSVGSDASDSESTTLSTLEKVKEFLVSTKAFLDLQHELQEWLEAKKSDGQGLQSQKEEMVYSSTHDGSQLIETRKTRLAEDPPDTLTSLAHLPSNYQKEQQRMEAEELEVQMMENQKQVSRPEHLDILNLSSEAAAHNAKPPSDLDGSEDSDSSIDNLISSTPASVPSSRLLNSGTWEINQSSLCSRLQDLVIKWSTPEHKNHSDVARYKLRNLVTELQHVSPYEIQFEYAQNSSRLAGLFGHYQHTVECWTGEPWDWWPLPRCLRPLGESETRLRWKCACGEGRWAEVPKAFVKRLQSMIRCLPMDATASQDMQPPPAADARSNPTTRSTLENSRISNKDFRQDYRRRQPGGSSSDPSFHRRPSGFKSNGSDLSITHHRVLFLVKKGGDYRLAQIGVSNLNSYSFFTTMNKEYFRLRGILRGWFSVWRYSHCDFYKFEKFDDHEFALKMKDSFPDYANTDYEYYPRPMDNIPPISEHEFTKRFYACHKPCQFLRLHRKCKKLRAHSSDILKFLPKKKTELEEAGDKREYFWGIYAREIISLRWIIFYNFVCVSPLLAFFLSWIRPQGHGTDLQSPSIPLSIMGSMLSLFWSVFLSSLQFGKSH